VQRTSALEAVNRELAAREAELREAQTSFQGLLDNSPALIGVKDLEGRYRLINRRFGRLLGIAPAEIAGKPDHDLFPPRLADQYRANDAGVSARGEARACGEVARHDGLGGGYATSNFPLLDESGARWAIWGISTDITDRKIADDDLKAARLEALRASRAKS